MNDSLAKFASIVMEGSNGPTSEKCELLGTRAAQMSIDANIPLSEAVVKVAHSEAGLNNTHINNICWVANSEYFRKVASARKNAGAGDLVFEFELADPPDVTKRINAAAQPKVAFVREMDYQYAPEDFREKEAFAKETRLANKGYGNKSPKNGRVNDFLQSYHSHTEKPKNREAKNNRQDKKPVKREIDKLSGVYSHENPIRELGDLREELRQVQYEAMQKSAALEGHLEVLEERFYKQIKQAGLAGTPLGHMVSLLANHPDGDEPLTDEFKKVAHRLAKEEPVFFPQFAKTAEAVPKGLPDLEHPLYETYSSIRDLRRDHDLLKRAEKQAQVEADYVQEAEHKGMAMLQKEWGGLERPR